MGDPKPTRVITIKTILTTLTSIFSCFESQAHTPKIRAFSRVLFRSMFSYYFIQPIFGAKIMVLRSKRNII